jgi:Tol biopolymer transport system component
MHDTSIRKNEDKPKGHPRQRAVIIILLMAFAAAGIGVAWRLLSYHVPSKPTGQIFYVRQEDPRGEGQIMVLDLAAGSRQEVTSLSLPQYTFAPDTSPDGKWQAVWQKGTSLSDIYYLYIRPVEVKENRIFGPFNALYNWATWSPDSKWVIFSAFPELIDPKMDKHDSELWFLNLETGEQGALTDNTDDDYSPLFSPDGTKIIYVTLLDGARRLRIMDLAADQRRELVLPQPIIPEPEAIVYTFTWSPDSQWIAFERNNAGSSDIWIVRADGTDLQGIAMEPFIGENIPVWLP